MQSSFLSASRIVMPNTSSTLRLITPEAFLSTWVKAVDSPWRSDRKCSVPLGKLSIASRLMISVAALDIVGNFSARSLRYRASAFTSSRLMCFVILLYCVMLCRRKFNAFCFCCKTFLRKSSQNLANDEVAASNEGCCAIRNGCIVGLADRRIGLALESELGCHCMQFRSWQGT